MENTKTTALKINMDELEQATGGWIDVDVSCWFTPTGKSKDINGELWLECASTCGSFVLSRCPCHGKNDRCVDKWHKIDRSNKFLLPTGESQHFEKKPEKNYNK